MRDLNQSIADRVLNTFKKFEFCFPEEDEEPDNTYLLVVGGVEQLSLQGLMANDKNVEILD